MTDMELLELAAKAAQKTLLGFCPDTPIDRGYGQANAACLSPDWKRWNPLDNDGDALRLSVELELCIHHNDHLEGLTIWSDLQQDWIETEYGDDPYAATRRAIVRAAAEIGRAL